LMIANGEPAFLGCRRSGGVSGHATIPSADPDLSASIDQDFSPTLSRRAVDSNRIAKRD
jgi:hypothetical protein